MIARREISRNEGETAERGAWQDVSPSCALPRYFLVAPLTILFNKVFLPSLLDERLRKAALEDAKDAKHFASYPYATPLAQTPLDFLVDVEPRLLAHVAHAKHLDDRGAPKKGAAKLARARPAGPTAAQQATAAAGPSLEVLEEIYNETHWKPTLASFVMLGLLGYFLELPDTVQDIVMEEILLFIPATSFFVSKGIFTATGRVRRGTYSNGGFLLVFTLLFGNLSALALTAFLSRAQATNAEHHHKKRKKAHERASKFAETTDAGRSAYLLPGLGDDDDDDDDADGAGDGTGDGAGDGDGDGDGADAPADDDKSAVPQVGIAFEAAPADSGAVRIDFDAPEPPEVP